jgi:ketosteroid isomerase-like protein
MRALAVFLILIVAAPALARPLAPVADVGPDDRAAIQRVISDQIAAFRRDDGEAAFALAAPGIQRMFGNPESFMAMVRGGYQPVYRPREFAFRELVIMDRHLVQMVAVVGPDGQRVSALYHMERQPDGTWRIAGCHLVEPEDENA